MFVCLGNICRSPAAHAVLEDMVREEGLSERILVDSSGTGASYHRGAPADPRMRRTASAHGVSIHHRAQVLQRRHLEESTLVLAMDRANFQDITAMCRTDEERARVRMFRDFDPEGRGDVPDPWYGGLDGFDLVWDMVTRTCRNLLNELKTEGCPEG